MTDMLQQFSQSASEWSVPLAFAWAGWMTVGLVLSLWFKRTQEVVAAPAYIANWDATPSPSVRPRPKSGANIQPASVIKPQHPQEPQPGDAFADLEAMLDSQGAEEIQN